MAQDESTGCVGCLILFLIISFIFFSGVQVIWRTAPAWGTGIVLTLLAIGIFHIQRVYHLNSPKILSRMVDISFDGQKLNLSFDEHRIKSYAHAGIAGFLGFLIGVGGSLIVLHLMNWYGYLRNIVNLQGRLLSYQESLISGYIISTFVVIMTIIIYSPGEAFKNSIITRANKLASRINLKLEEIEELRNLEKSIKSIVNSPDFNISFPTDYHTEIQNFINNHQANLLFNIAELNHFIFKKINQAQNDKKKLEKARALYLDLKNLLDDTGYWICKSGSETLINQSDMYHRILSLENIEPPIKNREWDKLYLGLEKLKTEILRLKDLASKIQETGYKEENELYEGSMDVNRALKILGLDESFLNLPKKIRDEKIKSAYTALVKIYHPDHMQEIEESLRKTFEERLKAINDAYAFLKNERIVN